MWYNISITRQNIFAVDTKALCRTFFVWISRKDKHMLTQFFPGLKPMGKLTGDANLNRSWMEKQNAPEIARRIRVFGRGLGEE